MTKTKMLPPGLWTLAFTAIITGAWAQDQKPAQPVVVNTARSIDATVDAIDPATRNVTLDGPTGKVSFKVDPSVKNLENVHVGDVVTLTYYQGIAAQMAKGNTKVTEPAASTFSYGGQGQGQGVGASVTATVTILAINRTTNDVSFTRSDGTVDVVTVRAPNMQQFVRTLQPGDKVEITYTESLVVRLVQKNKHP
jgi:hypothetical protein